MTNDLRPLRVVIGNETLEITPTRVGFYNLIAYIAKTFNVRKLDAFIFVKNMNEFDTNSDFYGHYSENRSSIFNSLWRLIIRSEGSDYDYINLPVGVYVKNLAYHRGRYFHKEDMITIHGRYYPRSYREYVRHCEECGDEFIDIDKFPVGLREYVDKRDLGYKEYCRDCVNCFYDNIVICRDCGEIIDTDCDDYAYIDDEPVCNECLRYSGRYQQCEHCGNWFSTDTTDYVYVEEDSVYYCCEDCANRDGWYWNEDHEEYRNENRSYDDDYYDDDDDDCYMDEVYAITGYHNHKYVPMGTYKPRQKHKLYIGRETEVDGHSRHDLSEEFLQTLYDNFEECCFFETDGSLNEGFEIITQPLTESKFFNEIDWEKPFKQLRDEGFKSHDTNTCGMHFHYSKWYLGHTYKEQFNSAKKIIAFIENHWEDIVKFSRRKSASELEWCAKFGFVPNKGTKMRQLSYDHEHRYRAVNLEHLYGHRYDDDENGTIEIRICKGTLNTKTMLASADFFLHIVRNAKRISWKNIDNLKLWFKGINNPNTIEYIKSRNAFEGAF